MPLVIGLNPRGKGKKKMAAKKKRRKLSPKQIKFFGTKAQKAALKRKRSGGAKKKTTKKRTNPMPKKGAIKKATKSAAKKSYRYTRRTIGGVNMMGAAKSTVPLLVGAVAAKFAAKKFSEGGAEADNWTWKNYLLALAGGFVAAFATSAIIRKPGAAQKVFEGALLLVAYKLFTNEIAPMNEYTESWFGQSPEDVNPYNGALGAGQSGGQIWPGQNVDYVRGVDGHYRPMDESHRLPQKRMGDVMMQPNPRYGDVMMQPNPRYGGSDEIQNMIEADRM